MSVTCLGDTQSNSPLQHLPLLRTPAHQVSCRALHKGALTLVRPGGFQPHSAGALPSPALPPLCAPGPSPLTSTLHSGGRAHTSQTSSSVHLSGKWREARRQTVHCTLFLGSQRITGPSRSSDPTSLSSSSAIPINTCTTSVSSEFRSPCCAVFQSSYHPNSALTEPQICSWHMGPQNKILRSYAQI